jgi:ornithine carbamoyltransferase
VSFEIGIEQLGAQPLFLNNNKNRLHAQEAIMAAVFS